MMTMTMMMIIISLISLVGYDWKLDDPQLIPVIAHDAVAQIQYLFDKYRLIRISQSYDSNGFTRSNVPHYERSLFARYQKVVRQHDHSRAKCMHLKNKKKRK